MASMRIERSERDAEAAKLVSEVVAHLLRAASVQREEDDAGAGAAESAVAARERLPSSGAAEEQPAVLTHGKEETEGGDPTEDARTAWLVEETCNRQALLHRYEDIRRRERGGKWDGSGYPLVQADERVLEQLGDRLDPAEDHAGWLHSRDSRAAWLGLVRIVEHQFGSRDDVAAVVKLLGEDGEIQEAFRSQWPISKIVRALNSRERSHAWNDDRVDNAKRRLTKWIARIKSTHGLDAIDLAALLARYARQSDGTGSLDPADGAVSGRPRARGRR
jgi:hypothetical protein